MGFEQILRDYWWVAIVIVATFLLLYFFRTSPFIRRFREWRRMQTPVRLPRESRRKNRLHQGKKIGLYLSPIVTNLLLRPFLSIVAGQTVGWSLYGFAALVGSSIFPAWAALALAGLLTLFFALNDSTPIVVPKAHVAIVTFLGIRFRIYLEEGTHYWYAGSIGFNRSTDPLPTPQSDGEKGGFVYIGKRQLEIYERTKSKDTGLILSNVAGDFTEVSTKLMVVIQTMDPLGYANSSDPILDAAERARSALRTIVSYFTGVDNAVMKSVFSQLMGGHKLLAAFTEKPAGIHPRGSVVQNRSGAPIFALVFPDISPEELEIAKRDLRAEIARKADPAVLNALPKDGGEVVIQEREVKDHIVTVMDTIGAHFDHASVSNFSLSEEVTRQANIAAGEGFQRTAQVLSANTIKEVREIIAEDADKPGAELATMAALAKDGHAEIIYVPGADRLTRAAVAGASRVRR